jgi:nicotinamide riboside kinase
MTDPHPDPSRIGLLGGECTGKSTLARALAQDLPGCLVGEAVRDFVARHGRPPRVDEQAAVFAEQAAREEAAAERCSRSVVIADPAPLMTAVYSVLYFGDDSLLSAGADHASGYDLLVWCAPDLPWSADEGMRDGPDFRDGAETILAWVVGDLLQPRGIPVLRVVGNVTTRLAAVRRAWQPRASTPPT